MKNTFKNGFLSLQEAHIYIVKANGGKYHWTKKIANLDGLYLLPFCLLIY